MASRCRARRPVPLGYAAITASIAVEAGAWTAPLAAVSGASAASTRVESEKRQDALRAVLDSAVADGQRELESAIASVAGEYRRRPVDVCDDGPAVRPAPTGARAVHAQLVLEVQEQRSKSGSPARAASCPTLAEWIAGRYARWQERAQNERTRRKLLAPSRYLLASDLSGLLLDRIGTTEINAYVEWRRNVGVTTTHLMGEPEGSG